MPNDAFIKVREAQGPIDLSLMSHVINGHFLSGTYKLEGNTFKRTLSYLNRYIESLRPEERPTNMLALQGQMRGLIEHEGSINTIRSLERPPGKIALNAFCSTLAESLLSRNKLSLPGGWSSPEGGHSMLYLFDPTATGLDFYIYNAGAGLHYHTRQSTTKRELYSPVLNYHVPYPINQEQLAEFLYRLLLPQLLNLMDPNEPNCDQDLLYKEVFPSIHLLNKNARLMPTGDRPKHRLTAGQLSGNCSQQVLHQLLKESFENHAQYQQFIYKFKRYALDDYMKVIAQNQILNNRGALKLVQHALRTLERILITPNLFEETYIEQQHRSLKPYWVKLLNRTMPEIVAPDPLTAGEPKTTLTLPRPLPKPLNGGETTLFPEKPRLILPGIQCLKGGVGLLAQMDELLQQCERLKANYQRFDLVEGLEQVFIHLPVPNQDQAFNSPLPFYQDINAENQFEFYERLLQLQRLYQSANKERLSPRTLVVGLSALNTVDYLQHMLSLWGSLHTEICQVVNAFFKGRYNNPYFATNHPALDKRLESIKGFYLTQKPGLFNADLGRDFIQYYSTIIDSEPAIKEKLLAEHDASPDTPESRIINSLLNSLRCKALYAFCKMNRSSHNQAYYAPLNQKFIHQNLLEKNLFCILSHFIRLKWGYDDINIHLVNRTSGRGVSLSGRLYRIYIESTYSAIELNHAILEHQYTHLENPPKQALRRDFDAPKPKSDNDIQLFSDKTGITYLDKDTLTHRDFFHLRNAPSLQVRETIDYFKNHLNQLAKPSSQNYMRANLFQPGLLLDLLDDPSQGPALFKQVDAFIEAGMQHYKVCGCCTETSLFFIDMAYRIYNYAAQNGSNQGALKLNALQEQLSCLLTIHQDGPPSIQHSLHQYQFLTAMARFKLKPEIDTDVRQALIDFVLPSFIFMNTSTNPNRIEPDAATRLDYECAEKSVSTLLEGCDPNLMKLMIPRLMASLNLGEVIELMGSSDAFVLNVSVKKNGLIHTYTINLLRGLVFDRQGFAITATPLYVSQHPSVKYFNLDIPMHCFVNQNRSVLHIGDSLRFVWSTNTGLTIGKKLCVNGEHDWYALSAFNTIQARELRVFRPIEAPSLDSLAERNTHIWIHCSKPHLFIITEHQKPILRWDIAAQGEALTGQLKKLDASGNDNGYTFCIGDNRFTALFSTFESPRFMHIYKIKSEFQVKFLRYGLNVLARKEGVGFIHSGQWVFRLQDKPTWKLITDKDAHSCSKLPHLPELAALIFEEETTQKQCCYIAIQPFIAKDQQSPHSEFHHFKHDVNAFIHEAAIKEKQKRPEDWLPWQRGGNEQFIVCPLDKNGEPQAEKSSDALYLCYFYLGNHCPEKAWYTLQDIVKRLGGLQGTTEELYPLEMILQALPRIVDTTSKNAVVSTPAYVACQMKALALFVGVVTPDRIITFPKPSFDDNTPDGFYKNQCIINTEAFYTQLNEVLYRLYTRFQTMQQDETHDFRLTDNEKLDLLTYYHTHLPGKAPKALGSLGIEWQTLSLKMLKREWTALEAEKTMGGLFPRAYQKRQEDILHVVHKAEAIQGYHCQLTLRPIDLSIRSDLSVEALTGGYWQWDDLAEAAERSIASDAMSRLNHFNISLSSFMQSFPYYYQLVTTESSATSANKTKLLDFCYQYLVANRYVPLEKQLGKLTYICNILYRIAHNLDAYNSKLLRLPLTKKNLPAIAYGIVFQWKHLAAPIGFKNVLTWAKELPDPLIAVYEQQDTASLLLAVPRAIWESCDLHMPIPSRAMKATASRDLLYFAFSHLLKKCALNQNAKNVIQEQAIRYQLHAKIFGAPPHQATSLFSAGAEQGNALEEMKRVAHELLSDASTRNALQKQAKAFIHDLNTLISARWSAILQRANSGFEATPHDALHKAIRLDAALIAPLTQEKILALYSMANKAEYTLATGLSEQDIDCLHTELTHWVSLSIRQQSLQRFVDNIALLPKKPKPSALQLVTHDLLTEDLVDYQTEPVLALFQYYEKVLLRPQQKAAISRLASSPDGFSFTESIEKIIMGGGKSKVILPLLAKIKARGTNLVVIEVPRALLETNIADLSQTSMVLFNQTVHRFDFRREQDCEPDTLSDMHARLIRVITQKNYLVTTGDAVQSLELKYIEILLNAPDEGADDTEKWRWSAQIEGLDKLVTLFRTRADVIIDEVHQALLFKKKLNYTIGEKGCLPMALIKGSVALYDFLDRISLSEVLGDAWVGKTLASLLDNNQLLPQDDLWTPVMQHLSKMLVTHPESPLQKAIANISPPLSDETKDALSFYLLNQGNDVPACILDSPPKTRILLALYKEQVSHLSPITLQRKLNEKYGKSNLHPDTGLAIPYAANNEPNERSRFGNSLESMNFSIQMGLKEGVPSERLRSYLQALLEKARFELSQQPSLRQIEQTPTGVLFHAWAPDYQLNMLFLEDKERFPSVYNALRNNKRLICNVLETEILPKLAVDSNILHSNAFNHVDIYRSCQGCTGTPWNSSTYHPRLVFNQRESPETDGFIINLLDRKNASIRTLGYDVPFDHLLRGLLTTDKPIRAIIDICAAFKGISNQAVAEKLVSCLRESKTPPQYILYFNQDNTLCALSVKDSSKPIVLNTSDPARIDATLHCTPEDRFTYYDQSHTVGTDLRQAPFAHALALVDHETQLQHFLQGIMRMRGLSDEQGIEIIVPPILAKLTREELLDTMLQNEKHQLQQDNFSAVIAKMNNVIRNDIIQRLLSCANAKEKRRVLLAFKSLFVSQIDSDFFRQYGYLSKARDTRWLLETRCNQLMTDWSNGLIQLGLHPEKDEKSRLTQTIQSLIDAAIPSCLDQYLAVNGQEEGTEVEVQNQVELQLEQEQEQQQQLIEKTLTAYPHSPWRFLPGHQIYANWNGFLSLSALCQSANVDALEWGEMYVSRNYYQVYHGQTLFIGQYLKPVHALLFRKSVAGILDCVILSQQETEQLAQSMKKNPEHNVWLTNTQDTVLAGMPPDGIEQDRRYQTLIEKACFFNGEFLSLIKRETPLNWLWKDTNNKIAFYEKILRACRQTDRQEIAVLRQVMSDVHTTLDYFRTHPAQDYTVDNWWDAASTTFSDEVPQQVHFARYLKRQGSLQNITEIISQQTPDTLCDFLEANHFKTNARIVKTVLEDVDQKTADLVIASLSSMQDVAPEVAQVVNEKTQTNNHFLFNCLVGIALVASAAILVIAILALNYLLIGAMAVAVVASVGSLLVQNGFFWGKPPSSASQSPNQPDAPGSISP